jgi:thiamine monophosphate synthase
VKLLAITDRTLMGADPVATASALMQRLKDRVIVQIREKDLPGVELYEWTAVLLAKARETGAQLYVNGRADVVRCFAPFVGLHLPESGISAAEARSLMPAGTPIGRSIHAIEGASELADLYTVAPMFLDKGGNAALKIDGLRDIARAISPGAEIYALGGIDRTNAEAVFSSNSDIDGVAAIRAAWNGSLEALIEGAPRRQRTSVT